MATTTTRMAARMTRTIRRYSVIPMLSSFSEGWMGVGSGAGVTEGTAPETMMTISDTGTEITVGTTGDTMDMTSDVIDNISSKVGDESVHQLDGKVTVTLPYTLAEGQNLNSVKVYYVDDDAKLHQMVFKYDAERGVVVFETNHFSYYMIGDDSSMDEPVEDESGSDMTLIIGAVVVIAAIMCIGALVMVRRR